MTEWLSGPLESKHEVEGFDCGVESLNTWLIGHARSAAASGTARTYVWTASNANAVMAYYAITPTVVVRGELTKKQAGGSGDVPGYLLCKLALHRALHGQKLGGELLLDALEKIVRAADGFGGRLIVVDAIESAVDFYQHYGFKSVIGVPNRLVMKVATARNDLGLGSLQLSANREAGLVSMVLNRPDGSSTPFVGDIVQARAVAREMLAAAEERERAGATDAKVDLRAVMVRALGRDPFAEEE
ncbi:GNAT family N-acetyltransferase [Micromonospora aurantiaca (nom. illeg.)]|uniref:GNAT family N-acetyltransferase n=1 Tax=Micromonospora aurantiaca (nom. illeg.) TaxID=47850 RepID=UPI0033E63F04